MLFPRKLDGRYALLSRPSDGGHTAFGDIFYSESPDLVHWGRHRHVLAPIPLTWQATKVGAGPAPIETEHGWLAPQREYERVGDVPNVVFPTAALVDRDADRVSLYYGAADSVVCLAHARLSELVSSLL